MLRGYSIARLALITSVAGAFFLFFLSQAFQARETKIGEISEAMLGQCISVKAKVDSAFYKDNFVLFQLNDGSGKIKAVIFNPSREQRILLQKNSFVRLQGKVQLYEGQLEVVAEAVEQW